MAQAQGEFHKDIVAKSNKDALGVVVFSKSVIAREGSIAETSPLISTQFEAGDEFYGRAFISVHLDAIKYGYPSRIFVKFVQNGKQISLVSFANDSLPEADWSSWIYYMHEDFAQMLQDLPEGNNEVRLEVWTSSEVQVNTTLEDANGNKQVLSEMDSRGEYLAHGTFFYQK